MVSQSVETLIWISFRPILRLALCASTGFIITKADLMSQEAARGAAQIALNICIPSLFFSKIVPAFTPQNIGNLGPLVLVCLLYQFIGLLTCLMILPFFWVPRRFRWGFVVAGVWGNYGDLPTAVIMSVTAAAPFNGPEDQNLAIAYIAAFVLVFIVTLFPMGGHYLVAKDFKSPELEEDIPLSFLEKSTQSAVTLVQLSRAVISHMRQWHGSLEAPRNDIEVPSLRQENSVSVTEKPEERGIPHKTALTSHPEQCTLMASRSIHAFPKHVTFNRESSTEVLVDTETPSQLPSPTHTMTVDNVHSPSTESAYLSNVSKVRSPFSQLSSLRAPRHKFVAFLRTLLTAPTVAVILALIISVVQPLKGLFVPLANSPKAPDGQPPLAFLMDTTTFLGGASIPLGLICLGSALARLKIPRSEWRNMPIGAILALAVGRMVLQPVLGVSIIQGLTHVGFISAEDKVLRFVCIFFSCVPTATTQIFLTQVYSDTGSAKHLAEFLIPQYLLLFISSTALTAYSLHLLFE